MVFLYPKNRPDINEVVIVKITDINKLNVVASLMDYDDMTGYISYSELSKKKRYNLHKIVNINKEVIVQVTGFNESKNYAELSVRTLIESEITQFTELHQTYLKLYSLWRYIYMKLHPELNMEITKINSEEINNFMEKTLWHIIDCLDSGDLELSIKNDLDESYDEFHINIYSNKENLEKLYNIFLNPSKNNEVLNYITEYETPEIKAILDVYSQFKNSLVKQTKHGEFTAYSYELDGLNNLKKTFDFTTYEKFHELNDKYIISILYLTGKKYSLTLKQKVPMNDDINEKYDYLIQEIKTRCEQYNIVFKI